MGADNSTTFLGLNKGGITLFTGSHIFILFLFIEEIASKGSPTFSFFTNKSLYFMVEERTAWGDQT